MKAVLKIGNAAMPLYLRKSYTFPKGCKSLLRLSRRFPVNKRLRASGGIAALVKATLRAKHSVAANRAAKPQKRNFWNRPLGDDGAQPIGAG